MGRIPRRMANGLTCAAFRCPRFCDTAHRFYFYSNEQDGPVHVHVERDGDVAKFWLDPVRVQRSGGFRRPEILRIARLVGEHRERIKEAWDEHFGT